MPTDQHVAFVVNNYPPHIGGVQLHVQNLANALTRLGVRCSVVTLADRPAPEAIEDGISVTRLPRRFPVGDVVSFPRFGARRQITKWAEDHQVSAISTHTRFFPMSLIGVSVARTLGVRSIHTEHGSDFVRTGMPPIDLASRGYDMTLGRRVLRKADQLLAVSEGAADFVNRLAGRQAEVFNNAIDVSTFAAARSTSDRDRLVFIGRLVPGKGWREAVAVYRALVRAHPSLRLDLIGSGPQLAEAQAATADDPGIVVHGRVEPSEVPATIAGATLLNPTTLSEGFQTTLLESLAAGGRVVTYDVPGAQEVARLGDQVQIVAPDLKSLIAGTENLLASDPDPLPVADLKPWDWATQAQRYARLLSDSSEPTDDPR